MFDFFLHLTLLLFIFFLFLYLLFSFLFLPRSPFPAGSPPLLLLLLLPLHPFLHPPPPLHLFISIILFPQTFPQFSVVLLSPAQLISAPIFSNSLCLSLSRFIFLASFILFSLYSITFTRSSHTSASPLPHPERRYVIYARSPHARLSSIPSALALSAPSSLPLL